MVPGRLTQGLALGATAAAILAGQASPALQVVGGSGIEVQSAPWAVYIEQTTATARFSCTGSVVDASHILTAAHCVFDEAGAQAQPSQLLVRAGISSFPTPLTTDAEQDRTVASVRIHPGFTWTGAATPDDVAVLALSTPLDLSGSAVQAVALPTPGSSYPAGTPVGLAGFGRQSPTAGATGTLAWMTAAVDAQGSCGGPGGGLIANNGIVICASSPTSAVCNGDSGGGLVTLGQQPTLIGVVSAGSASCQAGSHSLFTYTGAPEILQFVQGNDEPPTAPRETTSTFLNLKWQPPLVVGNSLTCSTGEWSGEPQFTYSFLDAATGAVLQSGPQPRYLIAPGAVGEDVDCEVKAANDGGTTLAETLATAAIGAAPQARLERIPPLAGSAGKDVTVRLTLASPAGLFGAVRVCVALASPDGGRLCHSAAGSGGLPGVFPFSFRLRLRPGAPLGLSRISVLARAGVSSVSGSVVLRVARAAATTTPRAAG